MTVNSLFPNSRVHFALDSRNPKFPYTFLKLQINFEYTFLFPSQIHDPIVIFSHTAVYLLAKILEEV